MKPRIAIPEPCAYDPEYSVRVFEPYLHALRECGGEPVVISLTLRPEEMARKISSCAAVLLPGSKADVDPQKYGAVKQPETNAADPLREAAEELLLQDAYNLKKPILGICYGLQSLNVWRTGTLVQDIRSEVKHSGNRADEFVHTVWVDPSSVLGQDILKRESSNSLRVNSTHHQAADVVGDGLKVVGRCEEDGTVEAVESTQPEHPVIAVQWHPERSFDKDQPSRRLFEWLIHSAKAWRSHRQSPTQRT